MTRPAANKAVAEKFHSSGQAQLHPPDNSAHISSHNAVKIAPDPNVAKPPKELVERTLAARHRRRIDEAYAKAQKRAQQKGREIPSKDQYYTHWGYPYVVYGPYMYPVWYSPAVYGVSPSITAVCGTGANGSCASGTCGGGVASGACAAGGAGGMDGGGGKLLLL